MQMLELILPVGWDMCHLIPASNWKNQLGSLLEP